MARWVMQRWCCLSVKDGLETFGYIKIMLSYTTLLYLTGGFYAQYQNTGQIEVSLTSLLTVCCFAGDFVMTLLHLYSLRKDILPLIHLYLSYVVLSLVIMVVGLPFYFYYVLLIPQPSRAIFHVWSLVGTAVVAWTAIGLHILLALGVYSYGVVLSELRDRVVETKADPGPRRVSV